MGLDWVGWEWSLRFCTWHKLPGGPSGAGWGPHFEQLDLEHFSLLLIGAATVQARRSSCLACVTERCPSRPVCMFWSLPALQLPFLCSLRCILVLDTSKSPQCLYMPTLSVPKMLPSRFPLAPFVISLQSEHEVSSFLLYFLVPCLCLREQLTSCAISFSYSLVYSLVSSLRRATWAHTWFAQLCP